MYNLYYIFYSSYPSNIKVINIQISQNKILTNVITTLGPKEILWAEDLVSRVVHRQRIRGDL